MKRVEIRCEGKLLVPWKRLENIQGNLKELTKENFEKGKRRILNSGFKAPFFVWFKTNGKAKPENTFKTLDGVQRTRMLAGLEDDGIEVPEKLPAIPIFAKNEKEARDDLLGFVSQYGHVTEEGLYEFLNLGPLPEWDELKVTIDLPSIDLEQFTAGYLEDINLTSPSDFNEYDENIETKSECPKCGYRWNESR